MKTLWTLTVLLCSCAPVLGCTATVVGGGDGSGGAGGASPITTTTAGPSTTTGPSSTTSATTTTTSATSTTSTSSGSTSADHCASALHVSVGGSVSGTTCGGGVYDDTICQEPGNPGVFIYVDATAGTNGVAVEASAGYSLMAYAQCDSATSLQCQFGGGTVFAPTDQGTRLFMVSRVDAQCGAFTITASAQ